MRAHRTGAYLAVAASRVKTFPSVIGLRTT